MPASNSEGMFSNLEQMAVRQSEMLIYLTSLYMNILRISDPVEKQYDFNIADPETFENFSSKHKIICGSYYTNISIFSNLSFTG